MASYVFNNFKSKLMKGTYNLSAANNTYKIGLINVSAFNQTNPDDTEFWNSVSANWSITADPGYLAQNYIDRGLSGTNVSLALVANEARWSATNVTWASSTIDARGAVIYKRTDSSLICAIDFGSKKSSSNGDFTISWNAEGILNLG